MVCRMHPISSLIYTSSTCGQGGKGASGDGKNNSSSNRAQGEAFEGSSCSASCAPALLTPAFGPLASLIHTLAGLLSSLLPILTLVVAAHRPTPVNDPFPCQPPPNTNGHIPCNVYDGDILPISLWHQTANHLCSASRCSLPAFNIPSPRFPPWAALVTTNPYNSCPSTTSTPPTQLRSDISTHHIQPSNPSDVLLVAATADSASPGPTS